MKKIFLVWLVCVTSLLAAWTNISELPDAREHKKAEALNIVEARQSIGYPLDAAKNPDLIIRAKTPIVIIDSGFVGLTEYLKKNPDKKKISLNGLIFIKKVKKQLVFMGLMFIKRHLLIRQKLNTTFFRLTTKI